MDWVIILISAFGIGIFFWAVMSHCRAIRQRMLILRVLSTEAELLEEFEKVSAEMHSIYIFLCRDAKILYPTRIQKVLEQWDVS
jgi:hypothetical protein